MRSDLTPEVALLGAWLHNFDYVDKREELPVRQHRHRGEPQEKSRKPHQNPARSPPRENKRRREEEEEKENTKKTRWWPNRGSAWPTRSTARTSLCGGTWPSQRGASLRIKGWGLGCSLSSSSSSVDQPSSRSSRASGWACSDVTGRGRSQGGERAAERGRHTHHQSAVFPPRRQPTGTFLNSDSRLQHTNNQPNHPDWPRPLPWAPPPGPPCYLC